ncbi:MAG TPA: hypothetical protein PKW35_23600, partial [Nannocystaceae bacterium]|nr:hypothetical protein [Nannocystaceae bacterium]
PEMSFGSHHAQPREREVEEDRQRGEGPQRRGDHGRSSHIDRDGHLLHGRWFDDLDVYHKGFARARDSHGWMHVDIRGEPIYSRRFAAVEPFYNGQARVERHDGGLEIIDERGETALLLLPKR